MLSALAAAVATAAVSGTPCVDRPPCVYVTPDPERVRAPGTIYVYRGHGWRPGARISADFGSYCAGGRRFCTGVGLSAAFRADARGRFTFRLFHGRRLPPGFFRPAAAGGEADAIDFSTRHVTRDAIPPPPPSTRAQRAAAKRLARLVVRTRRRILTLRREMKAALAEYEDGLDRCRHHFEFFDDDEYDATQPESEHEKALWAVLDLGQDASTMRVYGPEVRAFADALERLDLRDPALRRAAEAWVVAVRRERPWPGTSFCEVMDEWSRSGYDLAQRPIDPRDPGARKVRDEVTDSRAIERGADRLRALGGGRAAEEAFEGGLFSWGELIG